MDNFCVIIGELQDTLEVKCDVIDPKGCSEKEVKFILDGLQTRDVQ